MITILSDPSVASLRTVENRCPDKCAWCHGPIDREKRPRSRFCCTPHKTADWKQRQNPELPRPAKPRAARSGRQISYGRAVKALTDYLALSGIGWTPEGPTHATVIAERVLSRALPERQRMQNDHDPPAQGGS